MLDLEAFNHAGSFNSLLTRLPKAHTSPSRNTESIILYVMSFTTPNMQSCIDVYLFVRELIPDKQAV